MKKGIRVVLPVAFWLMVWQGAALAVGKELLLPLPGDVLRRLLELAGTGAFWATAGATLGRVFGGMALGTALGAALAVLTFFRPLWDCLLSPAIRVLRATPVASFILLLWLWVSSSRVPGLIAALMVLPVVWGNVVKGLSEADPQLLELAGCYGFGGFKTGKLVYLPAALPYFASGCRTGMGLAWKAGVAAEVLCMPRSAIGTQILFAKNYLEAPTLFAWTIVVILLSFGLEGVVGLALRRMEGEAPLRQLR